MEPQEERFPQPQADAAAPEPGMNVMAAGPVLSYDVQQPAHSDGQHYIQLHLAPSDFIASARAESPRKDGQPS